MFYVAHYEAGMWLNAVVKGCYVGRVTSLWLCRKSGTGRVNFPLDMLTEEFFAPTTFCA